MDKNGLYPIYGTWHEPFWQTSDFLWMLVGLGILISMFFVWFFYKKYFLKPKKKKSWEEALLEFEKLKKLIQEAKVGPKDFYLSVSFILKMYFFRRYSFDVLGKTDEELILFLEKNQFNKDLLTNIKQIFQDGQEVKFANVCTLVTYLNRDLNLCISLIAETIPKTK